MSSSSNIDESFPNNSTEIGDIQDSVPTCDIQNSTVTGDTDDQSGSVIYGVEDVPPLHLCILLGFQHYLTVFGSTFSIPVIVSTSLCMDKDTVGLGELISTTFFISGLVTVLQSTFGVRLPIVQSTSFAFLTPTFAILSLPKWECPYIKERQVNPQLINSTLPDPGSDEHREMWQLRIREIQGAIMMASLFEVVIGFTGLIGLILKYIGPLAITPTIALIGLSLFEAAAAKAATQWYIALMTMFLIALFSQYFKNINIPCFTVDRNKGCTKIKIPIFSLFPVLLAMLVSWIICVVLTAAGAFPDDPKASGYNARTDIKTNVLRESQWFRVPYPGQWGVPTFSTAGIFGMTAGVLSSMVESVGDYYACARLAGAPPPPIHAVNRGIGIEGLGCMLTGAWGSGNGTTSHSENIGAIGITKVGSRRVVQVAGLLMVMLGCLGKFGALFVTIPDPVIGGMIMITFGMVVSVGLSNLQFVDLNSSRNMFILGVSLFFGLSFPKWITNNNAIDTGVSELDQIITVLLGTSMFVGGMTGFILDNTIPGSEKERGIHLWRRHEATSGSTSGRRGDMRTYDLPFIQKYLDRLRVCKYLPFCPGFSLSFRRKSNRKNIQNTNGNIDVESTPSEMGQTVSTSPDDTRF